MDNPHIVRIHDVFEENGTAYYVMEYLSGGSLSDRIPADGLPESEALGYIRQVCDALSYIHGRKILHLDIKPSNILFRKADEAVLIDFGISKHYEESGGNQTSSTPVGVSRGYAPLEQYKSGGVSQFTPATDIYSLGATLYKLLTGQTPPDADEVNEDGLPPLPSSVSFSVRMAVEKAMSPRRKDRPQDLDEFLNLLDVASDEAVSPSDSETVGPGHLQTPSDETTALAGAGSSSANKAYYKGNILVVNGIEYPMVNVCGGEFVMGDGGIFSDNRRHDVRVDDFAIGKYEVTQELWEAVMGDNPSRFKGARRPVECVSWYDCVVFIDKLNALTGASFRLPTEAEWEFAARGGNSSRGYKYSGSDSIGNVAWYYENGGNQTHDVGLKSPNELGIYDMSGNVCEWCNDWYGRYLSLYQTNPKGPSNGSRRVVRGGSWYRYARCCRVSNRLNVAPGLRYSDIGLRLCH